MEKLLPKQQLDRDIWVAVEAEDSEDSDEATFVNSFVDDFE